LKPPSLSSDALRAAVVFLHSSLEEVVRHLYIKKMPNASKESLDKIPFLAHEASHRPKSIQLGDLIPYRGQFVENIIADSIEKYVDNLNVNNSTQLVECLKVVNIDPGPFRSHLKKLDELMRRRHQVVHQMDRASELDPLSEPINKISYLAVETWMLTVKQFVDKLFRLVPNEPSGTKRPRKRPLIDPDPNKSTSKSADENRTVRDTSLLDNSSTINKTSQLKMASGWFELSWNEKRQYSFVLKAGNGEVLLRSEQYVTQAAAENGIKSVQSNCGNDARYDRKDASDGRCYFNLKAGNHQVIGTSQMYKAAAGRDNGVESVKTNGVTTTVKAV
jgi:uncharacterized protein YegP (UPF0339 family)